MTSLEMNAELFRAMSEIADDEALMAKLLKYAKRLAAKKHDDTLLTEEDFFAKVDEAREQISRGEGIRFTNREEMNTWLQSL
jgi:hypothetical protein